MKSKLFAMILALNVVCWAQTATPNSVPAAGQTAPAEAKAGCSCCEKMGDMHDHAAMHKDMQACMHSKDGKDARDCCAGKDSKSAMPCCHDKDANATAKDGKAASCCAEAKCEGKEMSCCTTKTAEAAHGCCAGNSCRKHEHAEHTAAGN
jgi:hypothetical protein